MFSGHVLESIAYLIDIINESDFVIGAKGLAELEADAVFKRLRSC